MASAKSSRSRASVPSGPITTTGLYQAANGAAGQESRVQLVDKLKIFKIENFDPDAYVQSKCQTMNEKELRHLCSYLQELKKASAEEMRKSVYANYVAFIRTSKEISDLEQDDVANVEDREPTDIAKWLVEFPDLPDVLLAERRVDEALDALDESERIAAEAKQNKNLSPAQLLSLLTAISDHRQKLADQLAEAVCQSSTHGVELRAAASALKRLGDGPRAHSLLLAGRRKRSKGRRRRKKGRGGCLLLAGRRKRSKGRRKKEENGRGDGLLFAWEKEMACWLFGKTKKKKRKKRRWLAVCLGEGDGLLVVWEKEEKRRRRRRRDGLLVCLLEEEEEEEEEEEKENGLLVVWEKEEKKKKKKKKERVAC